MGVSEKPRATRGILTIAMRKRVLSKAIRASERLLTDANASVCLSAIHGITQAVAMLEKLERPTVKAHAKVSLNPQPTILTPAEVSELLEKLF